MSQKQQKKQIAEIDVHLILTYSDTVYEATILTMLKEVKDMLENTHTEQTFIKFENNELEFIYQ